MAAVMSATAKFMRRKLIEVLGKISEINAIRRRKIKTLFRERYLSTRSQMLFFALCVVPVDLPICLSETALNRVQPPFQGSLLLVLGENPGNKVEQGIYFYY